MNYFYFNLYKWWQQWQQTNLFLFSINYFLNEFSTNLITCIYPFTQNRLTWILNLLEDIEQVFINSDDRWEVITRGAPTTMVCRTLNMQESIHKLTFYVINKAKNIYIITSSSNSKIVVLVDHAIPFKRKRNKKCVRPSA